MFGVKTRLINFCKKTYLSATSGKLASDMAIRSLMEYFVADTYGHRASIKKADMGYGWIHYGLARAYKPKRILCIGSRYGFIPAVLAQACKDNTKGIVDFVDPGYGKDDPGHWTGEGYWRTSKGKNSFKNFGLNSWINLYLTTSQEYATKFKREYEYIYLDGDHSYKGVSLDYKLFWPRLSKFGFMSFHDVGVKGRLTEGKYGVYRLWRKLEKRNSIVFPFLGSGLGIIQKATDENRHKNIL